MLSQIASAMGDKNILNPTLLAWIPNAIFLVAALVLLDRVKS
jgi:lipopolysaccharide export LptBFGC system permease protein LptF